MVVRIGQKNARPRRTFFREWREYRDLTQEQVAERMGTNKAMISKIERGQVMYSEGSLNAFADAVSAEPRDLISRPPPAKDTPPTLSELVEQAAPETRALIEHFLRTGTKG
jgi:transcriptional regulator with XRE-family HTH domain